MTLLHSLRRCAALAVMGVASMAQADNITVFAAASLKTALDEVAAEFTTQTGHRVTLSLAGSSALARQIEMGAPADIFISANPDWMDHLETNGQVAQGTRRNLVANRLVLIAHGANTEPLTLSTGLDLPALLNGGRLAMALVEAVPAGIYGKAALEHFGLWQAIAPHVAQTDNVRAALHLVALGEAPFGITYATDAAAQPQVSIAATFPAESHPPILYPVAIMAGRDSEAATALLTHLTSPASLSIFTAHGFEVPQ
ncbi:molybdate ABC transporter substrate-binding protein [Alisedimentitalea sp. MJ-SS2]|uniref:molybdate ABC transporter substrate-binding protein n=1 Tax=Aliisedimentitalea sp. MJ-SS2 TaxID=3049795 RepID=UPI00290B846D|nr:molybdate ABC transporter substrate-binding protein [Alisedimentitalea sp. MJ-SS2]MDU8929230.1 molybdate ABC transporter substrate-binding protein [Alisedimentitalea sp. MJ-SS2]